MMSGSNGERMWTSSPAGSGRPRASPGAPSARSLPAPSSVDRHQLLAAHAGLDQPPDRRLARRVEMADRVEADDALRAQRTVEQVVQHLALRCRLRRPLPAEMPVHQLVGLQHAGALADRHGALVEGELQRPLRRLAARPRVVLLHQHVVVDVADGEGAVLADAAQHLAQVRLLHRGEPACCGAASRRFIARTKKRRSRVGR